MKILARSQRSQCVASPFLCPAASVLHRHGWSLCRRGHQPDRVKRVLMGCDIKTRENDEAWLYVCVCVRVAL